MWCLCRPLPARFDHFGLKELSRLENHAKEHISSFILRCLPVQLEQIVATLETMPGVELHGADETGKCILLLDMPSEKELVSTVSAIEQLPGVINASMVYHHAE